LLLLTLPNMHVHPSLGARPDLAVTDNEATPGQHHTMR